MSLRPQVFYLVPEETARIARAANPKGNVYLQMYDTFGTIFANHQFASLFPVHGQPAEAPVRLALISMLQFAEGLTDRQAADAVRTRLDWKYLLCLELTDPGFHFSVLSAFRDRLIAGGVEHLLLDTLLQQCRDLGLLKPRSTQRTDSTHVLAAVRSLNRLERVGETLRAALHSLAVVAPAWLQAHVPTAWYDRYADRVDNARFPKAESARTALAATIGLDGRTLLAWIDNPDAPIYLRDIPAVQTLRQVWREQYTEPPEPLSLRTVQSLPPSSQQNHPMMRSDRTAPMNGLRRDIHAQAGGHVRELFETGGGIGSPAIDQGLDQRLWVKFGPIRTLDIAQVRGSRLRGRGEQGLHGLAELWYGRHGRSLGYGV